MPKATVPQKFSQQQTHSYASAKLPVELLPTEGSVAARLLTPSQHLWTCYTLLPPHHQTLIHVSSPSLNALSITLYTLILVISKSFVFPMSQCIANYCLVSIMNPAFDVKSHSGETTCPQHKTITEFREVICTFHSLKWTSLIKSHSRSNDITFAQAYYSP